MVGGTLMPYQMKSLSCDPAKIKGMSERLIVSHYENNYGGAVKRLNLIDEQLAGLDYPTAAGFLVNGLKREQLIAMNSMILHELFFDGLGTKASLVRRCATPWRGISDPTSAGGRNSSPWARRSAAGPDGCCCPGRRAIASSSISGRPTIATPWRAARQCSRSICTSTPITWTSVPRPRATSTRSWTSFAGTMWNDCLFKRRVVKGLGASPGNKLKTGGFGHACCCGNCDLCIGDGRHRRQCPGNRLEEGRRSDRKKRRRLRRRPPLRISPHRPYGDA